MIANAKIQVASSFFFVVLVFLGVYVLFQKQSTVCPAKGFCIELVRVNESRFLVAHNRYGLPRTVKIELIRGGREVMSSGEKWRVVNPWETRKLADISDFPYEYQSIRNFSVEWVIGSADAIHDENYFYRMPFPGNEIFPITQGYHSGFSHYGSRAYAVDFSMPIGTPVCAARGGVVGEVKDGSRVGGKDKAFMNYDNSVSVLHEDGTIAMYSHLRKGVVVSEGQRIKRGELIAYSGNTGFTTGPHLHFEVWTAMDYSKQYSIPVSFSRIRDRAVPEMTGLGSLPNFSEHHLDDFYSECFVSVNPDWNNTANNTGHAWIVS